MKTIRKDFVVLFGLAFFSPALADFSKPSAPACIPPPAGMVSWWPGDGNAKDIANPPSPYGGTLIGNVTYAGGKVGQAFSFNGEGFVEITNDNNIHYPRESFTVDAWIKTTATDYQVVISKYECGDPCLSGTSTSVYYISIDNGKVAARIRDSVPQTAYEFSGLYIVGGFVANGEFHHVAMVRDIGIGRLLLYVDGMLFTHEPLGLKSSGQLMDNDNNYDPLIIGAKKKSVVSGSTTSPIQTAELFFKGQIDEVEYYNRALSACEILSIYNAGSAGKCKPVSHSPVKSPNK